MHEVALRFHFKLAGYRKEAGEDYRQSKYLYAISTAQCIIHQAKECAKKLLQCNNSLLQLTAEKNGCKNQFQSGETMSQYQQENWFTLEENEEQTDIRITKQRTKPWESERKKYPLGGSSLYEGLAVDTLEKQRHHVDVFLGKAERRQPDPAAAARMEYGTKNEVNGLATLACKVLPAIFPGAYLYEEGAHTVKVNGKELMLISPDGSISYDDATLVDSPTPAMALEVKCSPEEDWKTVVCYKLMKRYLNFVDE